MLRIAALTALALAMVTAPSAAAVFDVATARAFCAAGDATRAERCLADQERAGAWIDRFLTAGAFPRYMARRAYAHCDARYGPDLRRSRICLQDLEDDSRNGGGSIIGSALTRGRAR